MPKMKTSKTAAKRFRKTGTGKLMRLQQNRQHLFEKKPSTRTRRLEGHGWCASRRCPQDQAPARRTLIQRTTQDRLMRR